VIGVRVVSKKRLDYAKKRLHRAKGPHFPDQIHPFTFKGPLFRDAERHSALDFRHLISSVRHNATVWTTDRKTRATFLSIALHEGSTLQTDANIVLHDRGSIIASSRGMRRDVDVGRDSIFFGCRNRTPVRKEVDPEQTNRDPVLP